MKRYIRSSEDIGIPGFLFEKGNKAYFYETTSSNITDKIARIFINAVCDERGIGDKIRQSALYSPDTLKDFKRRIDKATLYINENDWGTYYSIKGSGFSLNFPEEEFKTDVIWIR